MHVDGWTVRASGGITRRINSVNAMHEHAGSPAQILDVVEPVYERLGRPVVFRVLSFMPAVEVALEKLRFAGGGEVLTLLGGLDPGPDTGDVMASSEPVTGWLDAWVRCRTEADPDTILAMRRTVTRLMVPAMFFTCHEAGAVVAVAYAACQRRIAVLEAVATHPAHRRRGHARALIAAVRRWAAHAGADVLCLQVSAENAPARALYRSLGFQTELYRYHYRTAP